MYERHFGLKRRPFPAGPDTAAYYPATPHETVLARLLQAIQEDEGLCLLTGLPGVGKTLICHCLVDRLGEEVTSALITNSHLPDRASLFQAILYDLSLPYEGRREQELRLALTDFLLSRYSEGCRTVLVIDEAQHLGPDLLEEVRLLGNLETGQGKALQVVLAAQPEILETIERPELSVLRQRLMVRVQLEPLGLHEAGDYLVHQIRLAGGRPQKLIDDEATTVIARATQGVPRLLNQAAQQAFCLAYEADASAVDVEMALEALNLVGLEGEIILPVPPQLSTVSGVSDRACEVNGPDCAHGTQFGLSATVPGLLPVVGDDAPSSATLAPDRRPA
jgi:type II secretory pathway predicted ATPase ExeA